MEKSGGHYVMLLKQSASCAKLRLFEAVLRLEKRGESKMVTPSHYQSQFVLKSIAFLQSLVL